MTKHANERGMTVERRDRGERGEFVLLRDGERLGELTYVRSGENVLTLDHTYVSGALRGQGMARRLVQGAVEWARETNAKIIPSCSYARRTIEREPAWRDVLA